ncbi:hypothetical protein BDZ91DRAFT_148391 [Kalaharituber pfeilii]|nr:hypothetical protein BDZ91DRAFT_148391 [Kalaharituber pfeilii]
MRILVSSLLSLYLPFLLAILVILLLCIDLVLVVMLGHKVLKTKTQIHYVSCPDTSDIIKIGRYHEIRKYASSYQILHSV